VDAAVLPQGRLAEALELLAAMPEFVEGAIARVPADALSWKPSPGEFSVVEHACHLRDLEREGYLVRVRRLLAEAMPVLEGFDGATVAQERHYLAQDARAAARDFAAARAELLARLRALTVADLAREGQFAGRRICLGDLVAMIVEHDREHREELTRLLASGSDAWK
jgi:hypothetical protein